MIKFALGRYVLPNHSGLSNMGPALLGITVLSMPAVAQTAAPSVPTMQEVEQQILSLQQELAAMKAAQQAAPAAGQPPAVATTAAPNGSGAMTIGPGVTIKPGGFVAAESVYRSRNEAADIGSSFSGIPLPNTAQNHTSEFRGTARQSRLSLLAQGDATADMKLAAYFETDFLGAAGTANSNESNSYNLRMRVIYATLDMPDEGFHFLGGQNWSLLTMNKIGIAPRQENVPLTIEAQYVVGFNWARQWQLRAVEDLMPDLHFGLSVEEPQMTVASGTTAPAVTTVTGITGGSLLDPTATYSSDVAPDVVAKLAWDPGWGHYEAYGVARFFHDQIGATGAAGGSNSTTTGGGIGAGTILPLLPKQLEFQASMLAGQGIGRYGSGSLPDVTLKPDGKISPIKEIQAMVGLTGHPTPALDVYAYAGIEKDVKDDFIYKTKGYGLGSPLYVNSGCYTIGGSCAGNTSGLIDFTGGAWWKFYHGAYGTMQVGAEYEYLKRFVFAGVGGAPSVDENIVMTSFRYYPF